MKRLITLFVVIALVLSCTFVTYAERKSDPKGKGQIASESDEKDNTVENQDVSDSNDSEASDLNSLRARLKANKKNKEIRKQLIKEIVELRKQQNDNSIPVVVNGEEVKFDVPPVIKNNRTLIPVRAVVNAMGADVKWDRDTNIVSVTKAVYGDAEEPATIEIKINLNDSSVAVNGEKVTLDVPPQVVNNRTMVPIRFIAETFDMAVDWDSNTGAVFIDGEEDETEAAGSDDADTEIQHEQADATDQTPTEDVADSSDATADTDGQQ